MTALFTSSFGAFHHQGGAGCVNTKGRRLCRSLVFAPMPLGTGAARPADRP